MLIIKYITLSHGKLKQKGQIQHAIYICINIVYYKSVPNTSVSQDSLLKLQLSISTGMFIIQNDYKAECSHLTQILIRIYIYIYISISASRPFTGLFTMSKSLFENMQQVLSQPHCLSKILKAKVGLFSAMVLLHYFITINSTRLSQDYSNQYKV